MCGTAPVTNHALADFEDVPQADTEADIIDDLIRVLGVNLVFERIDGGLGEVLWVDYYEVGEGGLYESLFVSLLKGSWVDYGGGGKVAYQYKHSYSINCGVLWYGGIVYAKKHSGE